MPENVVSIRTCSSASNSNILADCTHDGDRRLECDDDLLDRLGIADRIASKVEDLSHGNQQRVQLVAALLHEPEMLVLDEPLAGLDLRVSTS